MIISEAFLFIGLLTGQIGRFQLTPDIAITLSDIGVLSFVSSRVLKNISVWKKIQLKKFFMIKPLALMIVILIVSLLTNARKFEPQQNFIGLAYLGRFVLYMMVYFVICLDKKSGLYWITWLYKLGSSFVLVGFIQIILYPDLRNLIYLGYDPHFRRMFSTLFDPNFTGIIFILTFIIGMYLLYKKEMRHCYTQIILLAGLVLTYSRSSFLAAVVATVYSIVVMRRWKLLIIVAELVALVFLVPSIGGISTSLTRSWSIYGRIENWKEAVQLWGKSPIIGVGYDMLRSISRATTISYDGYVSHSAGGTDNSYIYLAVTTGVVGIAAFTYFFRFLFLLAKKAKRRDFYLSLMYMASLIAIAVHSLFVNSMFYPLVLFWVWVMTSAVEKRIGTISDSNPAFY